MGLRLDIKKVLSNRSDRVKCVDFHPVEPWVLVSLYNGQVQIWNYETQANVRTFEICELPTRTGKFISRKNWFAVGSDDMHIRIINYNTGEKVHSFEAHSDYIRCIAIHPTMPYLLSSADDMSIKCWDWDKNWKNVLTFEGHSHYVMSIAFNPKDANTFASASLDKTIKIWNLGSTTPNFTLEGHERGVNWVDYYHGGEKPYIISGADDKLVKIWDYQNKTCVQTLEGHTQNVCVACFHPELPIIISGSEDGTVRVWHSNTYRLENTLNYGFERVWSIAYMRGNNTIALGYDEGSVVVKLGREDPVVSMDSSAKIIWAKHNEIQTTNIQPADLENVKDGERLNLSVKDLGNCEVYPQSLVHSPNGRFAVVCGDGEYIIYTALSWRNKCFGSALDFVWALDSNEYAVRESTSKIKTFKAFKEKNDIKTTFAAEAIYGGSLLGVKGNGFLCFYDWNSGTMIRRIDVATKNVYWSENGDLLTISCTDNFFILKYDANAVADALESGSKIPEDGIEVAFQVSVDIPDSVKNGIWVGDCFIYTTTLNRLNYLVGGQVHTVAHFDSPMYLLGYMPKDSRIFVADKDLNIFPYNLSLQLLEYQTAILRKDFATASSILPSLSGEQRNRIARFLEGIDMKELAMEVAVDDELKFDLAVQLKRLDIAKNIAESNESEHKWKTLSELAFAEWKLPLAMECLKRAKDLPSLMLAGVATGSKNRIEEVSKMALESGQSNIAFMSQLLLGHPEECINLLLSTDRVPEAALFARTYLPSQVPKLVYLWKEMLIKKGQKKLSEAIRDPVEHENFFPSMKHSLVLEMASKNQRKARISSSDYVAKCKNSTFENMAKDIKASYPDPSVLPSIADLIAQGSADTRSGSGSHAQGSADTRSGSSSQPASPRRQSNNTPNNNNTSAHDTSSSPIRSNSPIRTSSPTRKVSSPVSSGGASGSKPFSPSNNSMNAPTVSKSNNIPSGHPPMGSPARIISARTEGLEEFDNISDNMSYLSMEVNTTGTRSIKGDDLDIQSEVSYSSTDNYSRGANINGAGVSTTPKRSNVKSPQITGDDELDEILNM